ncbi:MAG: hypothetical protein ACRCTS_01090 [Fusobacteriaceae bacterium]
MKRKLVLADSRELQRKQFKIPENLNYALQNYAERIDATENSIINGLLEDFMEEIDFGTMIFNSVNSAEYFKGNLQLISPSEHIGFNSEGNSLTLEKRVNIVTVKMDSSSCPRKHSFRGEQHTRITEHDAEFKVVKTEMTSLLGLFNTFEELLLYFNINSSWNYQMNMENDCGDDEK